MPPEQPAEVFTISDAKAQRLYTGIRRAAQWTPFLLPHLRRRRNPDGRSPFHRLCHLVDLDGSAHGILIGFRNRLGVLESRLWQASKRLINTPEDSHDHQRDGMD